MVLPVHDDNPTRRPALVTLALVAVNVVVFLVSPFAGHVVGTPNAAEQCRVLSFLDEFAAKPQELLTNKAEEVAATGQVVGAPGREGCVVTTPEYTKTPFFSVLTAMFVHGGWLHLLGNMLFLWVFGNNVEDRLGRLRYLGFYLLCGYLSTYGFALLTPSSTQPLVGASGAIAGVLGAYLVLFPRAKVLSLLTFLFFLPVRLPAWLVLGSWFVLQYVYFRGGGLAEGGVAYGAHVIGFLVGLALVWSRRPARR
jgi:membrane associated rhomboid family serine protease